MKNIVITLGALCFVANLLVGLIITAYAPFNMVLNSVVIIVNTLLLYALTVSSIKDGFKASLCLLYPIMGIIEFFLGLFAPDKWENNWYLIICVIFLFFECALYAIINGVSKINQ